MTIFGDMGCYCSGVSASTLNPEAVAKLLPENGRINILVIGEKEGWKVFEGWRDLMDFRETRTIEVSPEILRNVAAGFMIGHPTKASISIPRARG